MIRHLTSLDARRTQGTTYRGDRTVGAVTAWIRRHASVAIETTADGALVSPSQARAIEQTLAGVRGSLARSAEA